jgi:hypothetical protein
MATIKTIRAGTPVKSGHYFNLKTWSLHPVETDGEALPGAVGETWVALSLPFAVLAAPLLGAGFLMFMPAIGFYLVARAAVMPLVGAFRRSSTEIAASMRPGLVPGEAHLTGKPGEAAEPAAKGEDAALDALEKEVRERRK